jgi:hypothetical protein
VLLGHRLAQLVADGSARLAFRRWARANVRPGQTMLTGVGVIGIDAVDVVDPMAITAAEAVAAGERDELDALSSRVARMDRSSPTGPWVVSTQRSIAAYLDTRSG